MNINITLITLKKSYYIMLHTIFKYIKKIIRAFNKQQIRKESFNGMKNKERNY